MRVVMMMMIARTDMNRYMFLIAMTTMMRVMVMMKAFLVKSTIEHKDCDGDVHGMDVVAT